VGDAVTSASVADGTICVKWAGPRRHAGIRYLFNSEPTQAVAEVDGCLVFGRFAILASTSGVAGNGVGMWETECLLSTRRFMAGQEAGKGDRGRALPGRSAGNSLASRMSRVSF